MPPLYLQSHGNERKRDYKKHEDNRTMTTFGHFTLSKLVKMTTLGPNDDIWPNELTTYGLLCLNVVGVTLSGFCANFVHVFRWITLMYISKSPGGSHPKQGTSSSTAKCVNTV